MNINWIFPYLEFVWKARKMCVGSSPIQQVNCDSIWIAPLVNEVRVDVDAAFDVKKSDFSVAVVIRNHFGLLWLQRLAKSVMQALF